MGTTTSSARAGVTRSADVVRLVVEPLDASTPYTVDLPQGTSFLTVRAGRGERLAVTAHRPRGHGPAVRLEVLGTERATPLALFVPAGLWVRLNGLPAPVVTPLRVRDQVQLDARTLLHVTVYLNPRIEAPTG